MTLDSRSSKFSVAGLHLFVLWQHCIMTTYAFVLLHAVMMVQQATDICTMHKVHRALGIGKALHWRDLHTDACIGKLQFMHLVHNKAIVLCTVPVGFNTCDVSHLCVWVISLFPNPVAQLAYIKLICQGRHQSTLSRVHHGRLWTAQIHAMPSCVFLVHFRKRGVQIVTCPHAALVKMLMNGWRYLLQSLIHKPMHSTLAWTACCSCVTAADMLWHFLACWCCYSHFGYTPMRLP